MRPRSIVPALAIAASLATQTGCLSKSVPEPTRYYRPALEEAATAGPARAKGARAPTPLRLRRVSAATHLRDRIAVRVSDVEVGFNDLERWTETPAVFVERALSAELFERRPLARTESGASARLDVEVRAFEESRAEGAPAALVSIWISLADPRDAALLERTFTARRAMDGRGADALARAATLALTEVVKAAAQAIEAEVARLAPPTPPSPR